MGPELVVLTGDETSPFPDNDFLGDENWFDKIKNVIQGGNISLSERGLQYETKTSPPGISPMPIYKNPVVLIGAALVAGLLLFGRKH